MYVSLHILGSLGSNRETNPRPACASVCGHYTELSRFSPLCRAPVELDHQVVNKCMSQMLFEVVAGRFESGPFALSTNYRLPSTADHSRLQRRCGQTLFEELMNHRWRLFKKESPWITHSIPTRPARDVVDPVMSRHPRKRGN